MTVIRPEPANTRSVEPKVKWGTAAGYVVPFLLLALSDLLTENSDSLINTPLPSWAETLLLPIVPALSTFLAAYNAKHQWRVRPNAQGGASGSTEVG